MVKAATAAKNLSPFGHALSGAGGAVLALTITYPLDVYSNTKILKLVLFSLFNDRIKTRLQVQTQDSAFSTKYTSATDALFQIVKNEGIEGLYVGLPSGIIGTASTNFAYFYWYSLIRNSYVRHLETQAHSNATLLPGSKELRMALEIGTLMELLLGALAGACAQMMTIPVSVVTTRQQTQTPLKEDGGYLRRRTMVETAQDIIRDEGVFGLWKGLKPALVLTINPAITYGMFERLKSVTMKWKAKNNLDLTSIELFLIGLFSKTLATVVTYPYIMAKVRLQWKPKDYETNERVRYKGAVDVLLRVLQNEGWMGWYKGMQAQIFKAVLSQALLFVIKDKLTIYTFLLFNSLKRKG